MRKIQLYDDAMVAVKWAAIKTDKKKGVVNDAMRDSDKTRCVVLKHLIAFVQGD